MQLHYIHDKVELMFNFSKNVNKWKPLQTTLIEAKCLCSSTKRGKSIMPDLGVIKFLIPIASVWIRNHFLGFSGWLWVIPSDDLGFILPAMNQEKLCLCHPSHPAPWHNAHSYYPISYRQQLKHKHTVIFLDEIVQTFQNSLCIQICMLSESTTQARGIYGKGWKIWKGNSLGSCLIFLNINPQTVSLNILHICATIKSWHFCFSLCPSWAFKIFAYFCLFFASLPSCLLHLEDTNPASAVTIKPCAAGWCEGALRGDLGLQNPGHIPRWDIYWHRLPMEAVESVSLGGVQETWRCGTEKHG